MDSNADKQILEDIEGCVRGAMQLASMAFNKAYEVDCGSSPYCRHLGDAVNNLQAAFRDLKEQTCISKAVDALTLALRTILEQSHKGESTNG